MKNEIKAAFRNEAQLFFHPCDFVQSLDEEGKRGMRGVFDTPTRVELAKTVHACLATPSVESASLKPFARRTVFVSGTGQSPLPRGCGKNAEKALSSLPPPLCLLENSGQKRLRQKLGAAGFIINAVATYRMQERALLSRHDQAVLRWLHSPLRLNWR